nr:hypothetical protein [Tanacetum cinerariifolium]
MHILNEPSFFLTNKTGAPQGEELGLIKPLSESSCSCSDNSFISNEAKRYGAWAIGATPRIRSIGNSTGRAGGRPGKFSGNTLGNSWMIVPSAVALGIYLAYVPYEEEFQYLAFILAILVPVIVLAIGVDLCLKN